MVTPFRGSAWRGVALLVLGLGLCACHRGAWRTIPTLSIRMPHGATEASFVQMRDRAEAAGYAIDASNAAHGVFSVLTRSRIRVGEPRVSVVVQCYADGHATLVPLGTRIDASRAPYVTDAQRREIVRLAQLLESGAEP